MPVDELMVVSLAELDGSLRVSVDELSRVSMQLVRSLDPRMGTEPAEKESFQEESLEKPQEVWKLRLKASLDESER